MATQRRHLLWLTAAAALAALGTLVGPSAAWAHGLLVSKRDLPIPEWLFGWGASVVLIVSFLGLSLAWRTPRFDADRWSGFSPRFSRAIINPVTGFIAGAIAVALLVLVIWSGLRGTDAPDRNFSVTFVFVTFWLGFAVVSVLFGDVFRAFNPWRAIAKSVAFVFTKVAGQSAPAPFRYPERLGLWPAAVGILAFGWLELVYGTPGFQAVGLTPKTVGIAALAYTAYTLVAMSLFGIERWLDRGESFSVLYGMFARLSIFEVRDGQIGRRAFLSGAPSWGTVPGSAAMVLFLIGVTAYDGASEGLWATPAANTLDALTNAGVGPVAALRLSGSLYLAISVAAVYAIYWAGVYGMHTVKTTLSTAELGRAFAHSFIPIALAYLVAHYFTLVVFAGQAQFGYLLSDPLGNGSDLFGTAANGINYAAVGASTVWYVQVGALVFGHVLALVLGHDRALKLYGDPKLATRSQYWMLSLMVAFTSLGLFLLSQSNS